MTWWRALRCMVGWHRWAWIDVYETECGVYMNNKQICLSCGKWRTPR